MVRHPQTGERTPTYLLVCSLQATLYYALFTFSKYMISDMYASVVMEREFLVQFSVQGKSVLMYLPALQRISAADSICVISLSCIHMYIH